MLPCRMVLGVQPWGLDGGYGGVWIEGDAGFWALRIYLGCPVCIGATDWLEEDEIAKGQARTPGWGSRV